MNISQNMERTTVQSGSLPSLLLRLEGLTVLVGAVALYAAQGWSGLTFVLLLFVPDVSMIGYAANPRLGSLIYNAGHVYTVPALLAAVGLVANVPVLLQLALIWLAHIGLDRVMGYGLKYPTQFKDTHMQRV